MITETEKTIFTLLMSDIDAIPTSKALRIWALRWVGELRSSPWRDELRQAYIERMEELKREEEPSEEEG